MDKLASFLFLLFIYCCLCCCCGSGSEDNLKPRKDLSGDSGGNVVTLPVYAIYIFGSVLVLLILLVIFLIFVILKPQFFEICKKTGNDSENIKTEFAETSRQEANQKSLKRLHLNRSHSFEFKNKSGQYQVLEENDNTNTLTSIKGGFGSLRTPTRTEASGNISPRIIKGITKDMPIILPEQMSQICKEVLTRTNRNDDTTGSLRNLNKIGKEHNIVAEENEKKYASSPGLDVCDVIDEDEKTLEVKNSNKEEFDNRTQICSNDVCDVANNLKENFFNNKTQLQSNNIYDMPKELEILKGKDLDNQPQSDDMYEMAKQMINSNKEDFDHTEVLSNNIYDMPKEFFDNAQLKYVKPHFPQKSQEEINQSLKKYFQKSDYDSPLATYSTTEHEIDKIDSTVESNAYDFPTNTIMEAKLYINANCIN